MMLGTIMQILAADVKVKIRVDGETHDLTPKLMAKYGARTVLEMQPCNTDEEGVYMYFVLEKEITKGYALGCTAV